MKHSNMGAHYRLTFRAWLYQHRTDDSAIGDIARALMADGCLPEQARRLSNYQHHLAAAHQASPAALEALRAAWTAYEREITHAS